jgi:hypothetical protein
LIELIPLGDPIILSGRIKATILHVERPRRDVGGARIVGERGVGEAVVIGEELVGLLDALKMPLELGLRLGLLRFLGAMMAALLLRLVLAGQDLRSA